MFRRRRLFNPIQTPVFTLAFVIVKKHEKIVIAMSGYGLDWKDFEIFKRLPSTFGDLHRELLFRFGIPDGTLTSRLGKLERWYYIEKIDGTYCRTQVGDLALKLGPDEFIWLSEQKKWTKIPDEEAPQALHQLAKLEAKISRDRRLYRGTIIDPPGLPPLVRFILGLSAAKGAHNFIKKEDEDPFVASVAAFIVLYLVCVEA